MLVIRKIEAGEKRGNVCGSLGLAQAIVSTIMAKAKKIKQSAEKNLPIENYKIPRIKCKLHYKF